MQILMCSLNEFKEKFPKFKQIDKEENSNLRYYKIVLDDEKCIGLIKDIETKLFEFIELDNGKKYLKEDPNFEYSLLSLFADDHETRDFDAPITGQGIDVFELEETVDIELKSIRRWDMLTKIINILIIIVVLIAIAVVLYLKGNGKI